MARKKAKQVSPSDAVDEQLARYRAMRDFSMTAEPSGSRQKGSESELPFVIQKHAATRLHYDFRLGWQGVLKSWAVAKGPSYYPGDKRLAVQVEDHPMEYGGFEGTIPKGQYGGGTVMVWDQGTWEPQGDADEGFRTGRLKFVLHGQKLKGKWTLVRMGGRAAREAKPNWLLIKEHDEYERGPEEQAITESKPDSVVTGRDIEAIGTQEDHVWQSKESKKRNLSRLAQKRLRFRERTTQVDAPDRSNVLNGIPEEKMPEFIPPHLAAQVSVPPDGEDWIHELKLDGYRIQLHVVEEEPGKRNVFIYTRGGLDWTHRMPDIAKAAAELPVKSALIDGEVVVLDPSGKTSFADLQAAFQEEKDAHLTYVAFDLLHLDGHNVRDLALDQRKAILEGLLGELGDDSILRFSAHIRARGEETFRNACKLGAEGIISKLASSKYSSGRSKTWLKAKCVHQQEFVIGGFTPPGDGADGVGSLLLGYYQDGKLMYAGRTGTGFTHASQKALRKQLDELQQSKASFAELTADARKDAVWVKPDLVAEVQFATWTGDHRVRQASFQGLREDKPAMEIRREEPIAMPKPSRTRKESSHNAPVEKTSSKATSVIGDMRLTHPEKILDDESNVTKKQLAEYYFEIADHLLPFIAGRPLSIVRCPEGCGKPCFFQKHVGQGVARGIDSVLVPNKKGEGSEEYITVSTQEGLVGLAQMGVLEIHPWGSRNDSLETPDQLIFDLDPDPAVEWKTLVEGAHEVRDVLKELKLVSFVKSTGGKGLHVVVPIEPKHEWADVKEFTRNVARILEANHPDRYLIKMTKSARKGRIFLDYLRNDRGSTAIASYSPRARKGVRVAIPLQWEELHKGNPIEYGVANFNTWKKRLKNDPWEDFWLTKQALSERAVTAAANLAESAG
ncbi:DNA ligase D [Alloacidobacterium dinghuense]|uniref:DNA ligase (ATP) n=1 Tax=Alloacidobacterium dinghuense TaxID=2763107 RepID=A0A7G8BP36_9BACT|nr:DNA ligase D [Alloacidobacterium dinghuense]QNI34306.1 DNA ligase D [Alloacidobacterium dinghuense]